jgi:prophage antirepressor-like protein
MKTIMHNGVNWYKAKDITKELGFKTYDISKYVNPNNQRFRSELGTPYSKHERKYALFINDSGVQCLMNVRL